MPTANETGLDQSCGVATTTSLAHPPVCATMPAGHARPQERNSGARPSREQALIQARASEASAKHALAQAIARAEHTCATELALLAHLEADLNAIEAHLRAAGYISMDQRVSTARGS